MQAWTLTPKSVGASFVKDKMYWDNFLDTTLCFAFSI